MTIPSVKLLSKVLNLDIVTGLHEVEGDDGMRYLKDYTPYIANNKIYYYFNGLAFGVTPFTFSDMVNLDTFQVRLKEAVFTKIGNGVVSWNGKRPGAILLTKRKTYDGASEFEAVVNLGERVLLTTKEITK